MNALHEIRGKAESKEAGFLAWLVERSTLTGVTAERVQRVRVETSDRLAAVLLKLGLMSEARLAEALVGFTGLVRFLPAELSNSPETPEICEAFLRREEIIPLRLTAHGLEIACWDALNDSAAPALQFALGLPVTRQLALRAEILGALNSRYGPPEDADDHAPKDALTESDEVDRLKDMASDAPVIRLVLRLIDEAVLRRASDIHLEPSEQALHVRLRIDGLLVELESQPRAMAAAVISRVKVMAGLNIAERRLPQDGRIRVSVQGKDIDFRVATSPVLHGESVVLRILDRQDVALDFDALGFDEDLKARLREASSRSHGILLVTGPTGSGKTTTLYAALKEINTPDKKILTVEDPVEYVLAGVNQVPIKPQIGLTFAAALRAFLRQDPDVLMVGEIRDRETAEIAIQAALTGHLLLSTLHTNTAAAAITRLLDMGIDNYLLTSTLHLVIAQRLVRRLCPACREGFVPGGEIRLRFNVSEAMWYRARGCTQCQGSGYRGRSAIFEALRLSDAVRAKIQESGDAHEIEAVAVREGMRTMLRHGLERVAAGATTIEEVLRVTAVG